MNRLNEIMEYLKQPRFRVRLNPLVDEKELGEVPDDYEKGA